MPDVLPISVVVVTRNRKEVLDQCLRSIALLAQTPAEILVVDNASTDGTPEMVAAKYPHIRLLRQAQNTGAAGGRNIGIHGASQEICLCIDDDATVLTPHALSRCLAFFQREPGLAVLALRIVDQHGQVIRKLIPRRDRKEVHEDTEAVNFSGTGFGIHRPTFVALGGFWDKLNPYFGEEPDYCYRLLEQGFRVILTPHIVVQHKESASERPPERRLFCGTRNAPWMALRSLPWPAALSLTVLSLGYFFLIAARYGQMHVYAAAVKESARGYRDVYRIRKPISWRTCRKVLRHSGLLFF